MDSVTLDRLTQRLASLGYTYDASADIFALTMVYDKVCAHVRHACNIETIPESLEPEIIDAVCGEFLQGLKMTGRLTGIELEGVVKAITEGDTKVEFAAGTASADDVLNSYLTKLATIDPSSIAAHRRLKW